MRDAKVSDAARGVRCRKRLPCVPRLRRVLHWHEQLDVHQQVRVDVPCRRSRFRGPHDLRLRLRRRVRRGARHRNSMTSLTGPPRADGIAHGPPRRGTDGLKDDLARQLTLMAHRSTPYRRLVPQIVQLIDHRVHGRTLLASMKRAWQSREFRAFYERPLLLFAALRGDAMADGPSHPLHAALRDIAPEADAITEEAVRSALDPSRTGLWTTLGL